MPKEESVFDVLSAIDITSKIKEKNKAKYLPWATAVEEVLTHFPDSDFEVVRSDNGNNYFTDGKTCWVETSVTIKGKTRNEMLAVMDYRNTSISADKATSVDVNKAIKRCLVKNFALFGLGLSLYYGEELSDNAKEKKETEAEKKKEKIQTLQNECMDLMKKLVVSGKDKDEVFSMFANTTGKKNPSAVTDITKLEKGLNKLKEIEENGNK